MENRTPTPNRNFLGTPEGRFTVSGASKPEEIVSALKQQYHQLESQNVSTTQRWRDDQFEKHQVVLITIENLKQKLKSEVANRKETELEFEGVIERRIEQIEEQFNVTYLNSLYEMRVRLTSFEERQQRMQEKNEELTRFIKEELDQQREELVKDIQEQQ